MIEIISKLSAKLKMVRAVAHRIILQHVDSLIRATVTRVKVTELLVQDLLQ